MKFDFYSQTKTTTKSFESLSRIISSSNVSLTISASQSKSLFPHHISGPPTLFYKQNWINTKQVLKVLQPKTGTSQLQRVHTAKGVIPPIKRSVIRDITHFTTIPKTESWQDWTFGIFLKVHELHTCTKVRNFYQRAINWKRHPLFNSLPN